jgi:hypothetical protein
MQKTIPPEEQRVTEGVDQIPGIIEALGNLEPGVIITEEALARLFDRHIVSVKRAVQRGELPPPVKLFGQNSWTAGSLLKHIEGRLEEAQNEVNSDARRFADLAP